MHNLSTGFPQGLRHRRLRRLSGGENRRLIEGSRLGFHQFYLEPIPREMKLSVEALERINFSGAQLFAGLIAAYLAEMGVDGKVLTVASMALPGDMR